MADPLLVGGLISGAGSLLGSLFGDNDDSDTLAALERIRQMGKETYDPYIQRGFSAQDRLNPEYEKMVGSPMDFLNQIISGYKPSEGYKFREKNALNAARNSAAAGGISGTYNDQLGQAELVNGLLGDDMQQWLQNVLGIYGGGISGFENQAGRGFTASQSLADLLGGVGSAEAGLAHSRQQAENQRMGNIMGGVGGLLGQVGSAAAGGKFSTAGNTANRGMPGTASLFPSQAQQPNRGSIYGRFR